MGMRSRIQRQVEALCAAHHTRDPARLCEALGVGVWSASLPQRIRGFFYRGHGLLFLVLREGLPEAEQRLVLAHELGHVVLHPDVNSLFLRENTYCVAGRYEREANLFAGLLLLPDAARLPLARQGMATAQIAAASGLPVPLVRLLEE